MGTLHGKAAADPAQALVEALGGDGTIPHPPDRAGWGVDAVHRQGQQRHAGCRIVHMTGLGRRRGTGQVAHATPDAALSPPGHMIDVETPTKASTWTQPPGTPTRPALLRLWPAGASGSGSPCWRWPACCTPWT